MRRILICVVLLLALCWISTATGQSQEGPGDHGTGEDAMAFEVFASFKRIEKVNPLFALEPPMWAAATHAIIVDETVHYYWCKREYGTRWLIMHATAPIAELCPRSASVPLWKLPRT